ncbi:hypothetical protein Tco_0009992 [Tanacetum coccineum]
MDPTGEMRLSLRSRKTEWKGLPLLFHAVPPPYTGNYMPSRPDLSFVGLDDSVYKTKENTHKQVEYPRKSQSPRGNRRNWNGMMTQKLVNGFEFIKKACFVYGSFNHLLKDCDFHDNKMVEKHVLNNKGRVTRQREIRPVWNNVQRVNHQNKLTHPHPKRNFVLTAVATKLGQVPINAAKQNSPRAVASISTARPVNIVTLKSKVNDSLPKTYSYFKAHSLVRRAFNQKSAAKTNNFNEKVNTARVNNVTTAGSKAVVSATKGNGENAFKHMTENKSFLTDYQEIDGGFVAFGGSTKGVIMLELALTGNPHQEVVNFLAKGALRIDGRTCNIKQKCVKSQTPTQAKRDWDTKIPQSDGPPEKVSDEAVHKELGDRMERAATTASSLEAEHDSVNPTIYTTCIEQFWTSAKVKTVNRERQIQALVDKKKVIITKTSIRSDLKLDDAEGTDCLPTATILAELERICAKTTSWNKFSSTMASAILCLATNKNFNFSKYIFDNMVNNLEGGVKFIMYPRFVQVFLDKQVEGMSRHKGIYVIPSHTKKVFAYIKRPGKGFSGKVTPLFATMMVQATEDMGKDSAAPTDSHSTPIHTQPSSSKPQKKKSRRKQRKDSGPTIPDEAINEEHVATSSYELPQSALEIESLTRRVKSSEKRRKSRTPGFKRLKKVGSASRVESSNDVSFGAQEDASKQGRKITDLDADAEVTFVDETQ